MSKGKFIAMFKNENWEKHIRKCGAPFESVPGGWCFPIACFNGYNPTRVVQVKNTQVSSVRKAQLVNDIRDGWNGVVSCFNQETINAKALAEGMVMIHSTFSNNMNRLSEAYLHDHNILAQKIKALGDTMRMKLFELKELKE